MDNSSQPSVNPADAGDLAGGLRQILKKFLAQSIDDMIPAKVISYDESTNSVRLQPLIQLMATDGALVSRSQLEVPVFTLGGGDALLRFNLKPDDLGWLHANDRDISLFLQSLDEAAPNTVRMHSFDDGVFFPDVIRNFTASSEDADALGVLQNKDGTVRVSIFADRLDLNAPAVNIVSAAINITGPVVMTTSLIVNGVDYLTHNHNYIDTQPNGTLLTRITAVPNT